MSGGELVPADNGKLVINMDQVKDQVGDQVRAFLLNMLPKEAFDQVIETSWRKLTEPRPYLDYNGRVDKSRPPQASELEEMVTAEMRNQLKKRVAEWGEIWRQTEPCDVGVKSMFNELVEKAAGSFVHRVAAGIVKETAAALAGNMNNVVPCGSCAKLAIRDQQCSCGYWNS